MHTLPPLFTPLPISSREAATYLHHRPVLCSQRLDAPPPQVLQLRVAADTKKNQMQSSRFPAFLM